MFSAPFGNFCPSGLLENGFRQNFGEHPWRNGFVPVLLDPPSNPFDGSSFGEKSDQLADPPLSLSPVKSVSSSE